MDDSSSSSVATGKRGAEELESGENEGFVGDGGGDASTALPAAAPKHLRKKSVSFTGEETYQVRAVVIFPYRAVDAPLGLTASWFWTFARPEV